MCLKQLSMPAYTNSFPRWPSSSSSSNASRHRSSLPDSAATVEGGSRGQQVGTAAGQAVPDAAKHFPLCRPASQQPGGPLQQRPPVPLQQRPPVPRQRPRRQSGTKLSGCNPSPWARPSPHPTHPPTHTCVCMQQREAGVEVQGQAARRHFVPQILRPRHVARPPAGADDARVGGRLSTVQGQRRQVCGDRERRLAGASKLVQHGGKQPDGSMASQGSGVCAAAASPCPCRACSSRLARCLAAAFPGRTTLRPPACGSSCTQTDLRSASGALRSRDAQRETPVPPPLQLTRLQDRAVWPHPVERHLIHHIADEVRTAHGQAAA
jgi:hypothetical protein